MFNFGQGQVEDSIPRAGEGNLLTISLKYSGTDIHTSNISMIKMFAC